MAFFKALYLQQRFFFACIGIITGFIFCFIFPQFFGAVQLALLCLLAITALDILVLFSTKTGIVASRNLPEKLSNGDQNTVKINIENRYNTKINLSIIDEIPEQFQIRNFNIDLSCNAQTKQSVSYEIRPTSRGEYHFGALNLYAKTLFGLVSKRYKVDQGAMVPTYPSFLQLKKYNLLAANNLSHYGLKKVRRIGHTMEFEQIKDYVIGDDLRTINWKATAKRQHLMVNQFQDEKSQPVYSIIDTGRLMRMPFNGLTLLDYAINASLVISNVVLKKQDKAGILTFSKTIKNRVVAEKRTSQMQLILENLYNIKTDFKESDFGRLYSDVKRNITHRSLLLLYTNFETLDSLHRQLPYLKGLAKQHLLVVIFFENTELDTIIKAPATTIQETYDKVVAEKFAFEKRLIVNELKKYGIYAILTAPEDLTINTINTYLEIKARGLL